MGNFDYTTPSSSLNASGRTAWWADYKFWLGIACSALFLFLAFRKVQWAELGSTLQSVDWRYLLVATAVFILKQFVRGLRWHILLIPLGQLRTMDAFAYLNIGLMANNLLPFRAGEIARAVLLGQRKGFSKSAVLGTIVVERLVDVLVLAALAVLLMLVMPIPSLVKQSALALGGVGCLGVAGLWVVAGRVFPSDKLVLPRPSESNGNPKLGGLAEKVRILVRSFASGLASLRSPLQAAVAVCYSTLAWALAVGFAWLVLQACHLDLPWEAALMVILVVNFGTAIPSSPGFIGVAHFLAVLALEPWELPRSAALGFAIVLHAQSFLITLVLGLLYLWLEHKSLSNLLGSPMPIGNPRQ